DRDMERYLSLRIYALHVHFDGIKTFASRDEQRLVVFTAKADIGRPAFAGGYVQDLLSLRVKYRHARPVGQVYIAAVVQGHAVGAHLTEQPSVAQGAVFVDAVGVGFAGADVGHVQRFAVGGTYNAVGLLEVIGHPREGFV